MSEKKDKTENVQPADGRPNMEVKKKMPKKCPSCRSNDILEGDGGDWYYCNNCMCQMDKDGNIVRPGYWS